MAYAMLALTVALSATFCAAPIAHHPPGAQTSSEAAVGLSEVPGPAEGLAGLEVAPERRLGYTREAFGGWADEDGDGCDTREAVLIAESVVPAKVGAGCRVLSGRWTSAYDGAAVTDPRTLDIDHVVSLAEAWRSGAWAWLPQARRAFANDERGLTAVSARSNRSKGDDDPAGWLPPLPAARCGYIDAHIASKSRWGLSVDPAEAGALHAFVSACERRQEL